MNKILTLYNIEFKRIYKLYFTLLGLLLVGNIGIVAKQLHRQVNIAASKAKAKASMELLKSSLVKNGLWEGGIGDIYLFTTIILGIAVMFCLIYCIVIWYRDFVGKNKTAYTLFMLPNNKFAIYISKAITIVVMIYGVIMTQILSWIIEANIIKMLCNIDMYQIKYIILHLRPRHLIQPYLLDFIMVDVIGVILAVLVIFTAVMIQRSFKIKGMILAIIYTLASILIYVFLIRYAGYSDKILVLHSIYYIALFTISTTLSYYLINKKIHL
ncbi:hypothetical protein QOZ84_01115 [Romboutsia sedimentorum]|uniref:ABC transporter permease n=1 Tax=Romboutsia sedimentorum TaxID=1368474 RepID=A0ABT7E627_9FIRM|nr:hypothetical protein [Romboutsia sedimentorum]MDK2562132.1 hypothetical protein [Romboutsia sedimentorum]